MTSEFHPLASQELTEASQFYEARAAGLGADFLDHVEGLVGLLAQFPDIGRPHAEGVRTFPTRRFPYSLVYQVLGERLLVLAVAHQRRKPRYWAGRAGSL
jgi:plasmid stabilization system protein ParE